MLHIAEQFRKKMDEIDVFHPSNTLKMTTTKKTSECKVECAREFCCLYLMKSRDSVSLLTFSVLSPSTKQKFQ